jgi:chromosome segregation ATPase
VEKDRLTRIEEKLDKISEKIEDINITMSANTQSLIIHEKRTDIAENRIALTELQLKEMSTKNKIILENIEEKIQPIYTHVTIINVIVKYVIPSIAGILVFLFKMDILK